jgi:hypothetical protein
VLRPLSGPPGLRIKWLIVTLASPLPAPRPDVRALRPDKTTRATLFERVREPAGGAAEAEGRRNQLRFGGIDATRISKKNFRSILTSPASAATVRPAFAQGEWIRPWNLSAISGAYLGLTI